MFLLNLYNANAAPPAAVASLPRPVTYCDHSSPGPGIGMSITPTSNFDCLNRLMPSQEPVVMNAAFPCTNMKAA